MNSLLDSVRTFGEAWARRDIAALRTMLVPEYLHTDFQGRVMRIDEWLAYAETQIHGKVVEFRDLEAREFGSVGVVTGANDIDGGSMGTSTIRFTQVWVIRSGDWKRVAFQATPVSVW